MEINPLYLQSVFEAKKAFMSNTMPSITMRDFFDKKFYSLIKKKMNSLKFKRAYNKMKFSYSVSDIPQELKAFLKSPEFLSFASSIVGKNIKSIEGKAYCMTWKDYTLINDETPEKPGIDFIIDFTNDSGFGGEVVYADGKGSYSLIQMAENSLSIVKHGKNIHRFMHYLNHYAKNKKRMLVAGKIL